MLKMPKILEDLEHAKNIPEAEEKRRTDFFLGTAQNHCNNLFLG